MNSTVTTYDYFITSTKLAVVDTESVNLWKRYFHASDGACHSRQTNGIDMDTSPRSQSETYLDNHRPS